MSVLDQKPNPLNACAGAHKGTLDVKLLDECDGKCCFCIERKGLRTPVKASVDDMLSAIVAQAPKSVLLLGGEPFLYPYLPELIEKLAETQIGVYITTNGTKLGDVALMRELAPNIDGLNLSMGFYSKKKNEEVTGIALNLKEVQTSFGILSNYGASLRINAILLGGYLDNYMDCRTMAAFSSSIGAHAIRFSEIQNAIDLPVELYVDATEVFKELVGMDPYYGGCERNINALSTITKATVKVACGLINPYRVAPFGAKATECHRAAPPDEPVCHPRRGGGGGCSMGVLYPNAKVEPGWQKAAL